MNGRAESLLELLLEEQQRTNQLLELLIEALGEAEGDDDQEPSTHLDGTPR